MNDLRARFGQGIIMGLIAQRLIDVTMLDAAEVTINGTYPSTVNCDA
jgi:hypothetical protein